MSFPPPPQEPATIREWDRRAIEEYGMPGVVLMENAGAGAARILLELGRRQPDVYRTPWIILCGPGNNGGDGFVVARHLHNAGQAVEVHLAFPPERLKPQADNTVNFRVLEGMAVAIHAAQPPFRPPDVLRPGVKGTVIDALLGTGLSRPLDSPYADWVGAVNECGTPSVALDLPTGLDAKTGEVLGSCLVARQTITFAAPKTGFDRREGPQVVGEVHVVDIGMPREIWNNPESATGGR